MPTLFLRPVGVSYAIEGIKQAGLDGDILHDALRALHGEAVAPIGCPVESVLIDRKAETWQGLMRWLEDWIKLQGYPATSWSGQGVLRPGSGPASLTFHA